MATDLLSSRLQKAKDTTSGAFGASPVLMYSQTEVLPSQVTAVVPNLCPSESPSVVQPPSALISVLIAVAVRLYRDGLAKALSEHKHLRLAGTVATSAEAQAAVHALQPHVVVIDVAVRDVLSLMRTLRAEQPETRILAFAVQEEVSSILDYAEAGADGFVTANGSITELVKAIESTAAGELLCSPRIAADLLRRATQSTKRQAEQGVARHFTIREQQVLSLLKQGRSNKEIASALHIAEATVKNHVHHLLEKLQVSTRTQAAVAISSQFRTAGRSDASPRAA